MLAELDKFEHNPNRWCFDRSARFGDLSVVQRKLGRHAWYARMYVAREVRGHPQRQQCHTSSDPALHSAIVTGKPSWQLNIRKGPNRGARKRAPVVAPVPAG